MTAPQTVLSDPSQSPTICEPRPRGGVTVVQGRNRISLSAAEAERLNHQIEKYRKDRRDGTGFFKDNRNSVAAVSPSKVIYSTTTPAKAMTP